MYSLRYSNEDYQKATQLAFKQGLLLDNICGLNSVITGILGEIIFKKMILNTTNFKKNILSIIHSNERDYDFKIYNSKFPRNFIKIEVKTCYGNKEPKCYYSNHVLARNARQLCDIYVFLQNFPDSPDSASQGSGVAQANKCGSILFRGCITYNEFHRQKKYRCTPIMKRDSYFVKIKDCKSFLKLVEALHSTLHCASSTVLTDLKLSSLKYEQAQQIKSQKEYQNKKKPQEQTTETKNPNANNPDQHKLLSRLHGQSDEQWRDFIKSKEKKLAPAPVSNTLWKIHRPRELRARNYNYGNLGQFERCSKNKRKKNSCIKFNYQTLKMIFHAF